MIGNLLGEAMPELRKGLKALLARWFNRKVGRRSLKALLVIVAIALIWYIVELINCSQLRPTNDPLFDRYARAVRDRSAWKLYTPAAGYPTALPQSTLAQWEDEFGGDPHYWQLRYFCAVTSRQHLHLLHSQPEPEESKADGLAILRLARSKQALDVDSAILLAEELTDELKYQPVEPMAESVALHAELDAVLAEIAVQYPDAQWGYFYRAMRSIEVEDYEQALALVNQGLAAPDKHFPECYPLEVVIEQAQREGTTGNPEISGALLESGSTFELSVNCYRIFLKADGFVKWVAEQGTRRDWDSAHKFACCVGAANGDSFFKLWGAFKLERMLIYQIIHYRADELQDSEREMLLMLLNREESLRAKVGGYGAEIANLEWGLQSCNFVDLVQEYVFYIPEPEGAWILRYCSNVFYSYHPARWRLQSHTKADPYSNHNAFTWKEFEEMGNVDLTTLEIPEDWFDVGAKHRSGLPEMHPDREKEYQRED